MRDVYFLDFKQSREATREEASLTSVPRLVRHEARRRERVLRAWRVATEESFLLRMRGAPGPPTPEHDTQVPSAVQSRKAACVTPSSDRKLWCCAVPLKVLWLAEKKS